MSKENNLREIALTIIKGNPGITFDALLKMVKEQDQGWLQNGKEASILGGTLGGLSKSRMIVISGGNYYPKDTTTRM